MLHFNYTLDNELRAPVGQLPSGIQTQAFEMALTRLGRKYAETRQMLLGRVPGTGAAAIGGMTPAWRARIQAQSEFISRLPANLAVAAQQVALGDAGDALVQKRLDYRWNRWAPKALEVYSDTLHAFQADVSKAMSNQPATGIPAVYVKMARVARTKPPVAPNVNALNGYTTDDRAYLGAFDAGEGTPMIFGALAGMSLVGLAAWWFSRTGYQGQPQPGRMDGYDDYLQFSCPDC